MHGGTRKAATDRAENEREVLEAHICPRFLGDICINQEPPWRETATGHRIYCHISLETLAAIQKLVIDLMIKKPGPLALDKEEPQ
jgi:hypothetical protein